MAIKYFCDWCGEELQQDNKHPALSDTVTIDNVMMRVNITMTPPSNGQLKEWCPQCLGGYARTLLDYLK